MRHGRAKAARKTLQFYALNGNIKAPYKIIFDGNFLAAIIKQKVPIFDRLNKLLQHAQFTAYTTRTALDELALIPGEMFEQARQFGLDECEIIEHRDVPNAQPGKDSNPKMDIKNLTRGGNKDGWFICTQDEDLSDTIRQFPNVPQMRLTRGVLILEAPSSASRRKANEEESGKQSTGGGTMTNQEKELVERIKAQEEKKRKRQEEEEYNESAQQRRKKKAKGPNPLSCKKKKDSDTKSDGKKRNRRKKKSSAAAGEQNS